MVPPPLFSASEPTSPDPVTEKDPVSPSLIVLLSAVTVSDFVVIFAVNEKVSEYLFARPPEIAIPLGVTDLLLPALPLLSKVPEGDEQATLTKSASPETTPDNAGLVQVTVAVRVPSYSLLDTATPVTVRFLALITIVSVTEAAAL